MKLFILLFGILLVGCPNVPEPDRDDPSPRRLPSCFLAISNNLVIKGVKVFRENGETVYYACGAASSASPQSFEGPACSLSGNQIFLEAQDGSATGLTGPAVELSEHCIDSPIDGRCKEWNCESLTEKIPYPAGCQRIDEARKLGGCNIWSD